MASGKGCLFEIGISVESGAVVAEELFALFQRDFALLHALCHPYFELAHEFARVVLYIVEHFRHCFTVDDLVDVVSPILYADMDRVVSPKRLCMSPSISWYAPTRNTPR